MSLHNYSYGGISMSQLKLTANSGGGTVALKGPASTTGNAAIELTVPGTGSSTLATTATAGKILQVVQTVKLDTFSTSSTSDVDVTGFSVSITPSSSSNKVLVMVNLALSSQSVFVYGILKRGSTQIGEADAASNRLRPTFQSFNTNEGVVEHQNFTFLDSPNTTSATTYKMQIRCATAGNATVNKSYRDSNTTDYDPRVSSTITVMEVAA